MAEPKKFSELGVKITSTKLIGQKQDLRDYLDKEIVIHNFVIKPSRYPGKSDRCLHLQYCFEDKMYVSFSIATLLMQSF